MIRAGRILVVHQSGAGNEFPALAVFSASNETEKQDPHRQARMGHMSSDKPLTRFALHAKHKMISAPDFFKKATKTSSNETLKTKISINH
jgi:hypothetical protein